MSDVRCWPTVGETVVHDAGILDVRQVRARSPVSGRLHDFVRFGCPDWVNVIPVTVDGDIVMVRQYRHGSGALTLEIPGGMVDAGESARDAARRELREETGYAAPRLEHLGEANPNPALFANRCTTWLAPGAHRVGPARNVGAEATETVLVPAAEIPARMAAGEICHALVVAAFHWYALAGTSTFR